MASNPRSVWPFFPPLELHGTACGETYVGIDLSCIFKYGGSLFFFFLNIKNSTDRGAHVKIDEIMNTSTYQDI